jgi:hypothetical protein
LRCHARRRQQPARACCRHASVHRHAVQSFADDPLGRRRWRWRQYDSDTSTNSDVGSARNERRRLAAALGRTTTKSGAIDVPTRVALPSYPCGLPRVHHRISSSLRAGSMILPDTLIESLCSVYPEPNSERVLRKDSSEVCERAQRDPVAGLLRAGAGVRGSARAAARS